MAYARNYGSMNLAGEDINSYIETVKRSQVYQATHRGTERLPSRNLSFISFSFGGKNIEDFELIACCEGDTMSRNGYADFEDLVSSYDIMDGQYYHGTIFKPNTLSLRLVSDSIDERKLNEFMHWFQGGRTRELILAEHPNRAIMARVSSPPHMEMIPYEKEVDVHIGGQKYRTSTTVYKGFISLELVSDMPFWYAKQNILFRNVGSTSNEDLFQGINIYTSTDHLKEALKVMYEDTIPSTESVMSTMHFGAIQYVAIGDDAPYSLIMTPLNVSDPASEPEGWASLASQYGYFLYTDTTVWDTESKEWIDGSGQTWYVKGACIEGDGVIGRIAGPTTSTEGSDMAGPLLSSGQYNFFYGGTAPSPTILEFGIDLSPMNGSEYINCIANTYAPYASRDYTTITVTSKHVKKFEFTTPNVVTSWNKAMKTFNAIIEDVTTWGDLSDTLRDNIRHPAVRAWCVRSVSNIVANNNAEQIGALFINDNGTISSQGKARLKQLLGYFFTDPYGNWPRADFIFDAEKNVATGTFSYWKAGNSAHDIVTIALAFREAVQTEEMYGTTTSVTVDDNQIELADNYVTVTENVGDMLRSNWLILEDHNEFTSDGLVVERTEDNPEYSHILTHDAPRALLGLRIEYKNMYL